MNPSSRLLPLARKILGRRLPPRIKRYLIGIHSDWYHRQRFRKADMVIVSFAKSGRTWLRGMIGRAIAAEYAIAVKNPFLLDELSCHNLGLPTIVETHDGGNVPAELEDVRGGKSAYASKKVIFLARDPRDVLISAYFQATKRKRIFAGTISEYLHQRDGTFDIILEYLNNWARQRAVPKAFLLVRYEDIHSDPASELRRVLDFIGLRDISQQSIQTAIEFSSFDNMRKLEASGVISDRMMLRPGDPLDVDSYKTRRGKVGGYTDYLSTEDVRYMNDRVERELAPIFRYGQRPEAGASSGEARRDMNSE